MQLNDWLTTTLSVLTIAVTILGVMIAIGAIFGYRGIKDEATRIATKTAQEQIASFLTSEQIQDKLKAEIKTRVGEEADRLFADFSMAGAFPAGADHTEPIAEEYPKDP